MRRRQLLAVTGAAVPVALTGCAGSDPDNGNASTGEENGNESELKTPNVNDVAVFTSSAWAGVGGVRPGEEEELKFFYKSHEGVEATADVYGKIGGEVVFDEPLTLAAGEIGSITILWSSSEIGEHAVVAANSLGVERELTTIEVREPSDIEIALTETSVSPTSADPNEEITVDVTIENTGDFEGDYTVTVEVGDETIRDVRLRLYPGDTVTISPTWSSYISGEYDVVVNGDVVETITVEEP